MEPTPHQHAALEQLTAVPGVVGSMVFDGTGVVASVFPPVFDESGLRRLAAQLAGDGYFQEWVAGDDAVLDLRYADGHVVVRAVDASWLLVLCTAQANAQLLGMSLTQVVRRLKLPVRTGRGGTPPPVPAAAPSKIDRLRAAVSAELGEHAGKALEILAGADEKPTSLLRATSEVERMTRLFISKKKADQIGAKLRAIVDGQ